ncbi:tetratricopeptide repeat protein [bacterium]|nr:tetratricopeptide repeat protein [bacterium]
MQSSTVQRERLVSPLSLFAIAGVFGVAFYFLRPEADLAGTSSTDITDVDQLQLAYLKAQKRAGTVSDEDVVRVIQALAESGRTEKAYHLLLENPDLLLTDALRFEIDLGLAAQESDISLYGALQKLVGTPQLHTASLLAHATTLSAELKHPQLSMQLYDAWANLLESSSANMAKSDTLSASVVYQQCGDYMLAIEERHYAVSCFQAALSKLPATASPVDLQLRLLPLLASASTEQTALISSLMQNEQIDQFQMINMASVFLAIQRPDLAYRIYARVALNEPEDTDRWLAEAARWAEASGKLVDAVVFLDAMEGSDDVNEELKRSEKIQTLLLQAGQLQEVLLRLSTRIAKSPDNTSLLEQAVAVAIEAGRPDQALTWNSALVSLQGDNPELLERQSQLALAAGDLHQAREAAQLWVNMDSDNVKARRQLARLSEWDGDLSNALDNWLWLSETGHGLLQKERIKALREVVRIGELSYKPGVAADALREITLLEKATDVDVIHLVTLYELDGRSEKASVALNDLIKLHGPSAFILRTLANHEYDNIEYAASLAAWDRYVKEFGHQVEPTLARIELLWRLDRKDDATHETRHLQGQTLISQADDYQIRILAEIAWRHRYSWLALLVQPGIEFIEEADQQLIYGRRTLVALQEAGKDEFAMREALKLWGNTGASEFALLALNLAVKVDAKPVIEKFSPGHRDSQALQLTTAYWNQLASIHIRDGDYQAARQSYQRALNLDSENLESIAGLLWMAIGQPDESLLQTSLSEYSALAEDVPALWQAMAIGYLQLGAASKSLVWFDKLLDQIDADYGMMLTYADALEYAGRSGDARKVRKYTLQKLRPQLVAGTTNEQSLLLRQFASLASRYEGVEFNQSLIDYLLEPQGQTLKTSSNTSENNDPDLWREDFAISWLMSTQQYEHARLIMARIHAQRLQAPAWQQVALALKDKDNAALQSIVNAAGPLSVGNHILALRQLGNDTEAYAVAQQALVPGSSLPGSSVGDRQAALEQYVSLRENRPDFLAATVQGRSISGLDSLDTGVEYRHTLANSRLGFSFEASNRKLDSDQYQLDGIDSLTDLSASVFFNDTYQSATMTFGISSAEQGDLNYATGAYSISTHDGRVELSTEVAYNETINFSPELVIAGAQNRLTLGLDAALGRYEFVRLRADASEINTRIQQRRVANGLGGSVELGLRGNFGSNNWSTSVMASQQNYDRESVLPEELRLSTGSSVNSVLAETVQRLSFGASLSRGGVNANFPQVSSPRYYLNSNVGQNWPEQVIGFQIDAGAGIRVLGGDELSFSVSHETQPINRASDNATSFGMHYRYHFQ